MYSVCFVVKIFPGHSSFRALGFLVYPPLQQSLLALPRWSQFLIAIFLFELGTYWGHRWAHTVPFLWRFHAVHHSSEHLDWAAAAIPSTRLSSASAASSPASPQG